MHRAKRVHYIFAVSRAPSHLPQIRHCLAREVIVSNQARTAQRLRSGILEVARKRIEQIKSQLSPKMPEVHTGTAFAKKNMPYRRLGKTGLQVPVFSMGSWLTIGKDVNGDPAKELLKLAFDNGINYFDTAEVYANGESELEVGRIIKELGWRRDEITVATKIYFGTGRKVPNTYGLSRKHIIEGLNSSLERLQLDHVDIVHAHRDDPKTSMREIVEAFTHVVRAGKAHYWGSSEWSAERIQEAIDIAEKYNLVAPIVEQPQYNLNHRHRVEREYEPIFKTPQGYGTTVWSPLDQGILTGKYANGIPSGSRLDTQKSSFGDKIKFLESSEGKAVLEKVKKLSQIAERLNTTTATLALAWTARQPNVSTVILGATKPEQLLENLKAVEIFEKLDDATLKEISDLFAY